MELRYLAPTGMLGSGFLEESLARGLAAGPAFMACDSGTTDDGPYQLGAGAPLFSRQACKRDLRLMLLAARSHDIPLLIGSCGGAGGNLNLAWTAGIVTEIAREENLRFRLALIEAEPDRDLLLRKFEQGRTHPLEPVIPLDRDILSACEHVVCMMGVEPFIVALEAGADVVLAGRASDTSMFAALPIKLGLPAGLAWHAAKILECGAAATVQRTTPDGMLCTLRTDGFTLEPTNPQMRCTPLSVAAHGLYENADPYHLMEPGGHLDLTDARYEAIDERRVRVSGSRFQETRPYTVKLEGARLAGYQSLVISGVRDPVILEQLDGWTASLRERIERRIESIFGAEVSGRYRMNLRVYGRDAVMSEREPEPAGIGHEVCLLMDFLADTPDDAHAMAATAGHMALHHPIAHWQGLISALAFPYAPHVIDRGPVYEFVLNHVVELDSPCELFRMTIQEL